MKNKLFSLFIIALGMWWGVPFAWGHSGAVHEEEMLSVFGISQNDQELRTRLHPTIEVFRKQIDHDWSAFYSELKKSMLPASFSWGTYGHRLFFHWGFNTDPRHSKALQERMNLASNDPKIIEAGYQCVLQEQARRNRAMLQAVGRLSAAQRKHHNAIATILYDTHIIGDYIEGTPGTQAAMIPLDEVVEDIIKHGVMNFDCDYSMRQEFAKDLRKAYRSSGAIQLKAQAVLDVMRVKIPKCAKETKIIKRIIYGDKLPSSFTSSTAQPSSKK